MFYSKLNQTDVNEKSCILNSELRTLKWFSTHRNIKSQKSSVIVVTHLLDTTKNFIKEIGKHYHIENLFAIPYSIKDQTLAEVQRDYSVITPISTLELEELLEEKCYSLNSSSSPLLIYDVGGYAHRIGSNCKQKRSNLLGIIEDTSQGHWRYERCASLHVPVISIAYSRLKDLENVCVGQAIVYSLENLLRETFYTPLCGKNVLVLGYGRVGRSAAGALKARSAFVAVYDTNPIARARAKLDGFKVESKAKLLPEADIILGVSGHCSFVYEDVSLVKDKVVLASGSSKNVEFDIPKLIKASRDVLQLGDYVEQLTLLDGKSLVLLRQGQPINFIHSSALGNVLDLVFTALFECGRVLEDGLLLPGLHNIPLALEEEITEIWERFYR